MTIDEKSSNERQTLYIGGRVDSLTAPELETFISGRLDGLEELVLDFVGVTYISSAGLRVLLATHKSMESKHGKLILRGVNEEVREVLFVTGFLEFMNVDDGRH